jgi:hypothetical protein
MRFGWFCLYLSINPGRDLTADKNYTMEEINQNSLFELSIDQESHSHLNETARWAKFLSIVGFITCGLVAILSFFIGSIMSSASLSPYGGSNGLGALGGAFITILYLIIAVIYFFPCLFLYQFSVRLRTALRSSDQVTLNQALKSQKSLFKYVGIMTIIVLSFYALVLVVVAISAAFGRH